MLLMAIYTCRYTFIWCKYWIYRKRATLGDKCSFPAFEWLTGIFLSSLELVEDWDCNEYLAQFLDYSSQVSIFLIDKQVYSVSSPRDPRRYQSKSFCQSGIGINSAVAQEKATNGVHFRAFKSTSTTMFSGRSFPACWNSPWSTTNYSQTDTIGLHEGSIMSRFTETTGKPLALYVHAGDNQA